MPHICPSANLGHDLQKPQWQQNQKSPTMEKLGKEERGDEYDVRGKETPESVSNIFINSTS